MPVRIANRFHPFSHQPGVEALVPGTAFAVKVFPTQIHLFSEKVEHIWRFDFTGPIEGFTVIQDLEKGRIVVFGKAQEGYFRFFIRGVREGIELYLDKKIGMHVNNTFMEPKQSLLFNIETDTFKPPMERLCLGVHKKQEWELIQKRGSLCEILPLWFQIGQSWGQSWDQSCAHSSQESPQKSLPENFLSLFRAGFSGMFVPQKRDPLHQGIPANNAWGDTGGNMGGDTGSDAWDDAGSSLLPRGANAIRSLFFEKERDTLSFIPHLPKEIVCGRMSDLRVSDTLSIDFRFSRRLLREVVLKSTCAQEFFLKSRGGIASYRMRTSLKTKGRSLSLKSPIEISPGITCLDHFQK